MHSPRLVRDGHFEVRSGEKDELAAARQCQLLGLVRRQRELTKSMWITCRCVLALALTLLMSALSTMASMLSICNMAPGTARLCRGGVAVQVCALLLRAPHSAHWVRCGVVCDQLCIETLAALYASAISDECERARFDCFDLIGGSWGGYMAHQIAVASQARPVRAWRLVLLDPVPPVAGLPPDVSPTPWRLTISALLITKIAAARSGDGGSMSEIRDAILAEVQDWPDHEVIARATQRLAEEGLVADALSSAIHLGRQAEVHNQADFFFRTHLAECYASGALPALLACPILLVLFIPPSSVFC